MRFAVIFVLLGLGLSSPALAQGTPAAEPTAPAQGFSPADIRALLEASRETAKATREAVDYNRVVPDILTQILTKLDKLEDKLDKVENAIKAQNRRR